MQQNELPKDSKFNLNQFFANPVEDVFHLGGGAVVLRLS